MSESAKSTLDHLPSRRVFVKASTAAAGAGICLVPGVRSQFVRREPPVVALTKEARDQDMTADPNPPEMEGGQPQASVEDGREKSSGDFLAERRRPRLLGSFPAGVVLSCIDSRAPAHTFGASAWVTSSTPPWPGKKENPHILGSMEFPRKLAGAKVVLVMGHSACGAVAGAVAGPPSLATSRSCWRSFSRPERQPKDAGERTADNAASFDAVARKRECRADYGQHQETQPGDRRTGASQCIKFAGAFYHLKTGTVEFFGVRVTQEQASRWAPRPGGTRPSPSGTLLSSKKGHLKFLYFITALSPEYMRRFE